MSGVEFIGFIISLISLIFLYFKNRKDNQEEHLNELKNEELEGDHPFKEFVKTRKRDLEARDRRQVHEEPPPPPLSKKFKQPKHPTNFSSTENYRIKNSVENRQMTRPLEGQQLKTAFPKRTLSAIQHPEEIKEIKKPSKAQAAIHKLPHLRNLVIYQEIMDKPKSLRLDQ